jgi:glycosyltransferase A (GT-A) superfamily protein (DUF2064 family)
MPAGCRELLIIFTRYPEPGKAKTRLIPALGAQGAAELQRRMTERTLAMALPLSQSRLMTIEVRYEGGSLEGRTGTAMPPPKSGRYRATNAMRPNRRL